MSTSCGKFFIHVGATVITQSRSLRIQMINFAYLQYTLARVSVHYKTETHLLIKTPNTVEKCPMTVLF